MPGYSRRPALALASCPLAAALVAATVLLGSTAGTPAHAAPAADGTLTTINQIGGATQAVAVVGDTVLAGMGPRVVAFAACVPSRPVEIGRSEPLAGLVRDVIVEGPYAYAAIGEAGLAVLDVRDLSAPRHVRTVPVEGVAAKLAPHEGLLFVVAGYGGLRIFELGVPDLPREIGNFHKVVTDVAIAGSIAYVVARDLMVVDVSDPTAPNQVSELVRWSDAVATDGRHLFAALSTDIGGGQRRGDLTIYDITDPNPLRAPVVGTLRLGDQARRVDYLDGTATVYGGSTMRFVDVSDPTQPRTTLAYETFETVADMTVSDGHHFLAAGGAGLRIVDLTAQPAPREIGAVQPLANAHAVVVEDGIAYVEDEGLGERVLVIDVRQPMWPHTLASIDVGVAREAMAVADGRLFVGTPDNTVRVYDVRDPAHPRPLGALPLPEAVWKLVPDGDYLFVANDEHLRAIDIRSPSEPYVVSSFQASGGATDLAVDAGFAYVTGPATGLQIGRHSLQVLDVRDPYAPYELGVMSDIVGWQHGVAAAGTFAYLGGRAGALQVADVADVTLPREAARLTSEGETHDIALANDVVYSAQELPEDGGRVRAYDVRDPRQPREMGALTLVDAALDVAEWRGHLLVAGRESGLVIGRTDDAPPLPTPPAPPSLTLPNRIHVPIAARGIVGPACR